MWRRALIGGGEGGGGVSLKRVVSTRRTFEQPGARPTHLQSHRTPNRNSSSSSLTHPASPMAAGMRRTTLSWRRPLCCGSESPKLALLCSLFFFKWENRDFIVYCFLSMNLFQFICCIFFILFHFISWILGLDFFIGLFQIRIRIRIWIWILVRLLRLFGPGSVLWCLQLLL